MPAKKVLVTLGMSTKVNCLLGWYIILKDGITSVGKHVGKLQPLYVACVKIK